MPEVRALVPLTDKDGKEIVPDQVVDVDAEQAAEWRAAGKVTLITTEQANAEAARVGNYGDVVGRQDLGQVAPPGPQSDEPPPSRKGKR